MTPRRRNPNLPSLWEVDDGERHHAVAFTREEALEVVAEAMMGSLEDYLGEHLGYEVNQVPRPQTLRVHFGEDPDEGRRIAGLSDGLTLVPHEREDWDAPSVEGPAWAWVNALASEAPVFLCSTVF